MSGVLLAILNGGQSVAKRVPCEFEIVVVIKVDVQAPAWPIVDIDASNLGREEGEPQADFSRLGEPGILPDVEVRTSPQSTKTGAPIPHQHQGFIVRFPYTIGSTSH